jgi:hypothetical protein
MYDINLLVTAAAGGNSPFRFLAVTAASLRQSIG